MEIDQQGREQAPAAAGAAGAGGVPYLMQAQKAARLADRLTLGGLALDVLGGISSQSYANAAMANANAMVNTASTPLSAADGVQLQAALQNLAQGLQASTPLGFTGLAPTTPVATTPRLTVGGVSYLALQPGVTVTHQVVGGPGTSLFVAPVVGGNIIVRLGLDGSGNPVSTQSQIAAAIAAEPTAAVLATAQGGTGIGSAAAQTALPFNVPGAQVQNLASLLPLVLLGFVLLAD